VIEPAPWYAIRRAQNLKPTTYTCPFCRARFPALTEHVLVVPAGDASRRRHAHTECALRERRAGRLPTRDEWLATQPRRPSLIDRLLRRVSSGD
jgi:hypothetical protein